MKITIYGWRVRRLELHFAYLPRPRSGGCRSSHLRFLRTVDDHSCPPLSAVRQSAADPARTNRVRSRPVVDALAEGPSAMRDRTAVRTVDRESQRG